MTPRASLTLTAAERERIEHIDRLVALGESAVEDLLATLSDRSWTVRRAAVAALAALGDDAAVPLCDWLADRRTTEHGIAAAVDALSTSTGSSTTSAVIALAGRRSGPVLEDVARILGRRRAVEAVELLRQLVADSNDNVAVAAIEALGAIGGTTSIAALVTVIQSKNFFRTFPAMQVAARSGDPRVIEPLAALLDDASYQFEAASALGRTGSSLAIGPLGRLLETEDDVANVRLLATSLDELWTRAEWSGAVDHVLETMRQRLAAAVPRFVAALRGGALVDRVAIVRILGAIGGASAVDVLAPLLAEPDLRTVATEAIQRLVRADDTALISAFASPDPDTRAAALPVVSTVRAAPAVRTMLADEDPEVRARACDALARIGDTASVKPLFGALGDPNPRVAHAAAAAIQSLGSAETPALAIEAVRDKRSAVRRQALRIIAYLGHDAAYDVVRAALGDPEPRVAELAVGALASLSDPRVDDVLAEVSRSPVEVLRAAVMRAAGHRSGDRMYALLEQGVEDDAAWVRYYACQGLGRLGRVSAASRLMSRLADATAHVRVAAIEALARLDTPQTWQLLMSLARSRDPDEQRAALVGIGQHTGPAAVALLVEASDSGDVPTRLIALSGLARSSEPAAQEQLVRAVRDADFDVRDAALSLLAERDDTDAARILVDVALASASEHPVHAALSRPGAARIAEIAGRLAAASDADVPVLTSALARMHVTDATHALFDALFASSPAVRRDAASALVAIGATGALAAVRKLADEDPDPDVRRVCAAAVAE